ncbi:hypothetical protein ABPG75_009332 [Micractinium tetrahymenae]
MGSLAVALSRAAQNGDLEQPTACLEAGVDPNARGAGGETPLFRALYQKSAPCVVALLAAGADPNAAADDGSTPLAVAARGGCPDCCRALLAAGAVSRPFGAQQSTPTHEAAAYHHVAVLCQLLIVDPGSSLAKTTDGRTPLGEALQWIAADLPLCDAQPRRAAPSQPAAAAAESGKRQRCRAPLRRGGGAPTAVGGRVGAGAHPLRRARGPAACRAAALGCRGRPAGAAPARRTASGCMWLP